MLLLLLLAPGYAESAAAPTELKRADALDMRRAGKVSEDERAVLRIEWRAGMSGVEADRSVQEIMAKLRQMEASVQAVGQVLRSLPAEKRAPSPQPLPAAEADEGPDWRLMAANLTALVLVAIWWFSRRRAQAEAAAIEARLARSQRAESDAITAVAMPQFSDFASPPPPPADAEPYLNEPFVPEPVVIAPVPVETSIAAEIAAPAATAATTEAAEPVEPVAPDAPMDSVAEAEGPAAVPDAGAPAPAESPTIDFVLEEADPTTVVAEPKRRSARPVALITPAEVSSQLKQKNIEPTLQLAEIMLSMGLEQGAAQTLVEYTEANPKHAIYHMLKLLGIYRKRGLHREFQETAEKLRKNFNIQAEDWARTESGEAPTLEKFSRVSEHVQSIWHQPEECIGYLRRLLEDNRDGARAGFPQSVAEEILLLVEILKAISGSTQEVA